MHALQSVYLQMVMLATVCSTLSGRFLLSALSALCFLCSLQLSELQVVLMLQIRFATLEELFDHYTYQKPVAKAIAIRQQVQPVVQQLVSSERVIEKDGVYHPSFKQPGKYKLDFSGEVNILRHAMLRMLQEHPGIAHADLDEHFISTHQPAWYETRVFPGT